MPVNPTYPGVYIEEVSSGVRTIMGVSTSVAAFVDFFARGPIDHAVQIFNWGDFQREFGGLHKDSEASYAIQQFFLNGGTEAWVVRVAKEAKAASAVLQSENGQNVLQVKTGRKIKGTSVEDPGQWGNMLRVDVDYDTTDPSSFFNLTVSEVVIQDGKTKVQRTETYRNLTMDDGAGNNAISVVNEGSRIIQLSRDPACPIPPPPVSPAQTGTVGAELTAIPTLKKDQTFNIQYGTETFSAVIPRDSISAGNLADVRALVEAAIRSAHRADGSNASFLAGATVQVINLAGTSSPIRFRFRILGGRTDSDFDPESILVFSEVAGGDTAGKLGLTSSPPQTCANVQQYVLGNTALTGFQSSGQEGEDGKPPGAKELIGDPYPDKTGMYALENVDLFNILCIPRTSIVSGGGNAMDPLEDEKLITEAISYCESRRAFFIVDTPSNKDEIQEIKDWMEAHATLRHKNAALYFPRVRIPDPLNGYRLRSMGASGTIAGLFARTDSERGVWKAPAGTEAVLRNVTELDDTMTDPENGTLNQVAINCLRSFPVYGNICWGARTLVGDDQRASEWKYIPVRRLALYIEESLYRGTKWIVFEPNDEPLWSQIRLNVGSFMHGLFRQGAFQGSSPREAYVVKCDKETTTQDDINRGIVNILVGFAPLKPAEFVIIKIQQMAGQIDI